MKKVKKLISLLLALAVCLSLVACGGPDKQPAIDAHNKAATAVNELRDVINENPEAYAEYVDEMNELIALLNEAGEALETRDDLDQDALDNWVAICEDIEQRAKAVLGE